MLPYWTRLENTVVGVVDAVAPLVEIDLCKKFVVRKAVPSVIKSEHTVIVITDDAYEQDHQRA